MPVMIQASGSLGAIWATLAALVFNNAIDCMSAIGVKLHRAGKRPAALSLAPVLHRRNTPGSRCRPLDVSGRACR